MPAVPAMGGADSPERPPWPGSSSSSLGPRRIPGAPSGASPGSRSRTPISRSSWPLSICSCNDPRIKGLSGIPVGGNRTVWIDKVLEYEGVNGSIRNLSPYGPGPDAEGSTVYSCHWFNPASNQGQAPQAAADWFSRFLSAKSGLAGGDEELFKGLAWSSHFLADMFVPYHVNGITAGEALARINAGNFIVGVSEAGPAFLYQPQPPGPRRHHPGDGDRRPRPGLR
ncbi:MAG: hypothetical protein MZV63_66415 [Marinilabiliales bacterium]|nr:hypothetical protein [Marinilabiliales bacterium]